LAIPGIFPPVVIDNNLHVDGGVMDNLPVESMYFYPVDKIIAISLSTLQGVDVNYEDAPSSCSLAWDKVSLKKQFKIPGISSIIINSLINNSQQRQETTKEKVPHFIQLDLKGIGMLDDKRWKEIIQKGYDQTNAFLANKHKTKSQ
jgi:predicted acylesterase/phospholipase RssA